MSIREYENKLVLRLRDEVTHDAKNLTQFQDRRTV